MSKKTKYLDKYFNYYEYLLIDNIFIYNGSKLTEITKEIFITSSLNGDKEITNDENIVIYFDSEEDAIDKGYRACSFCGI